jgi:hypothetical protein
VLKFLWVIFIATPIALCWFMIDIMIAFVIGVLSIPFRGSKS